jgi:putative intracellular protease/amidase
VATALDRAPDSMLITICQGALAAASAGLFNGYRCTTHHELIDQLQLVAPQANVVADRVFVIDGHWQRARVQPVASTLPSHSLVANVGRTSPPRWRRHWRGSGET